MASKTDIYNRILGHAGIVDTVSDPDEDTPQANSVSRHYQSELEDLLAECPWNFATLTDVFPAATGETHARYTGVYLINSDSLAVWRVNGYGNKVSQIGDRIVWEVEGQHIVTDEGSCTAQYITKNVSEGNFSPKFRKALELRVAIPVARERGASSGDIDRLENAARLAVSKAKFADSLEGSARPIRSNYLADARAPRPVDGSLTIGNF